MRARVAITAMVLGNALGCTERGEVLSRLRGDAGVSTVLHALDVSAGDRHSCAAIDGALFCWGNSDLGQLGASGNASLPVHVEVPIGVIWRQATAGGEHSCGLDDLGQVYCWGGNGRGQLGQGDRTNRASPTLVPLPDRVTRIATKFRHTCALLVDARIYCWGENKEGQLGQADSVPTEDETERDGLSPLPIGEANWRAVDPGQGHTCGIRLDGTLLCWGRNSEHELGGDERIQVREPILVTEDGPWLSVSAGQHHTCAVRSDLSIWCWGQNTASEANEGYPLGVANAVQLASPTRVGDASDWTTLGTNTFHTCAINREAELYCWGRNIEGQLGVESPTAFPEPYRVGNGFSAVSIGRFHTCAITTSGTVGCAGKNSDGQLGVGDDDDSHAEFSTATFDVAK